MADRPPKIEIIPKAAAANEPARAANVEENEPAMRMPSAAMRVDLPAEQSAVVPAYTQRRAYAAPKLSHPIPGKVKMVEPASQLVSQWLASVVRALRGMSMYADNNSRRKDFVDQSFSVLEDIFAKAMRVELVVADDHIAYGRDLVHYNPDPFESLPRLLFDGLVRKLTITRGMTALELVRLLSAIATDFSQPQNAGDDLVSILGRMALPHVRAKGPDTPVAAAPKYIPPPVAPAPLPPPAVRSTVEREAQPPRLPSAFFEPILDEPAPILDEPAPIFNEPAALEEEPPPAELETTARREHVDPFAEDDEATVLAQPEPAQKKRLAELAPPDDEATLQEGATAPRIDISDLLDEATANEGSKKR